MKTFLIILLGLIANYGIAQEANFFTDKWKVQEVVTIRKSGKTTLFHRDSTINLVDYSFYELKFASDGSYEGHNENGASYQGTWAINAHKDTITIDQLRYQLLQINTNNISMRSYSLQLGDTSGNLDTVATDFILYSVPDIVNGLEEGTFSSSNFMLFPNPVKGVLEVKAVVSASNEQPVTFRWSNAYGQLVKEETREKTTTSYLFNLTDLQRGVYFMELLNSDGKRIAVKKVIKE